MRSLAALSLGFMIVCAGCNLPDSPRATFMKQMRYEHAQWQSNMSIWQQDWSKNRQDVKDCLAEYESKLGQEKALLETLGNDEQIQSADFQLYKDFLLYIQKSEDQIKTYEFIEKMRAALPADKMETVEKLYHQLKQNESNYNSLQKQKTVLEERLMHLGREKDELARRGDKFILSQRLSY